MKPEVIPAFLVKEQNSFLLKIGYFVGYAQTIQIDITDGVFAGEKSWFPQAPLPYQEAFLYEAHLMAEKPEEYLDKCITNGFRRIIVHRESFHDLGRAEECIRSIKNKGVEVGVSLLLKTPLSEIQTLVPLADVVQIMSIQTIGVQGNTFVPLTYDRIRELRSVYPDTLIAVDGGVTIEEIPALVMSGVHRLCVGSALLKSETPSDTYQSLIAAVQT